MKEGTQSRAHQSRQPTPHAVWEGEEGDLPVWMILCRSRLPMLLKIRPQISQGWMYLGHRQEPLASVSFKVLC